MTTTTPPSSGQSVGVAGPEGVAGAGAATGASGRSRRPFLTSPVLVAMGVCAAAFYYRDPDTNVAQAAVYLTMAWAAPASIFVGLRRHRPAMRRGWVLIGWALALWATGETVWYFEALALNIPEPFGWPDIFYLSSVATLIWGIRALVLAKDPRAGVEGALDGIVLAVAGAAVLWNFSLGQQIGPSGSSMPVRVLVVLYPLADLVLLAFAGRLALMGHHGNRSSMYLTAGIVSLLTADLGFAIILQHVGSEPSWVDAGWLMFFAFLGAAALHPSMARIAEKSPRSGPPSLAHVILVSSAAMVGPFLGLFRAVTERRSVGAGLEVFTIAIVGAVVTQVALIARDRARHAERNRTATARLEAERALRQSEERLRAVARQVPIVLLAGEADGTCTVLEGQALANLGLQPGQLVGMPLSSAPASCRPIVGALQDMLAGSSDAISVDVVLAGRTFQVTASAVGPADGSPRGFLALATDVTERVFQEKRLERAARRQRANAEISATIVETALDSERLTDAVLEKASTVLAATCVMVSYGDGGEMVARPPGCAFPDVDDQAWAVLRSHSSITGPSVLGAEGIEQLVDTQGAWSVAYPLHLEGSSDRTLAAFRHRSLPPFDSEDYAFLLNVTEKTRLALENCRLFGDLRHELSERRRSEEVLRESEQRWRAFGTEASHQLRTPLTGLRLRIDNELAECDRAGPTPPEWRQILVETLQHLDSLEATVRDFLALVPSRQAMVEPLDVSLVLDEIAATWGSLIEASGREFMLRVEPGLPPAMISGAAVRQVLGVLLDNALRHGAGCVTLVAKEFAGSVALEVHDEGKGFPGPGDPSGQGPDRGSGHRIGLSLARSLAEAGGARLQLCKPGPRPSVSLFLPGCSSDAEPAAGRR